MRRWRDCASELESFKGFPTLAEEMIKGFLPASAFSKYLAAATIAAGVLCKPSRCLLRDWCSQIKSNGYESQWSHNSKSLDFTAVGGFQSDFASSV